MLRKNKLLGDLLDGDLYLLGVMSIFATFEIKKEEEKNAYL